MCCVYVHVDKYIEVGLSSSCPSLWFHTQMALAYIWTVVHTIHMARGLYRMDIHVVCDVVLDLDHVLARESEFIVTICMYVCSRLVQWLCIRAFNPELE